MLTFRSFEIVDAIARRGTLGRAAEVLSLTQPALTKALATLESEVGGKLFERRATGMEPTAFAQAFLSRWQSISHDLSEMRREIDRIRGTDEGRLKVATGYLAASSSEMVLGLLIRRFPGLKIESRQAIWSEVATLVRRGDYDIGVSDPTDAEQDPELHVEFLSDRPAHFICRAGHPLLKKDAPTLADILAYPMALNLIPARMAQFLPENFETFGFRKIGQGHLLPPIAVHSISSIRNVVMSSDAVSIMPVRNFVGLFRSGGMARIERFTAPWLKVRLGFITRTRSQITPIISAFMEEVRRLELHETGDLLPD